MYSKLPPAEAGCTIITRRARSPRGLMETGETVAGVPSNFSLSKGMALISSRTPSAVVRRLGHTRMTAITVGGTGGAQCLLS